MSHWKTKEKTVKIAGVPTPLKRVRRVKYVDVGPMSDEPVPVGEYPAFVKCSGCHWNAGYATNTEDLKYHLEHCPEVDW